MMKCFMARRQLLVYQRPVKLEKFVPEIEQLKAAAEVAPLTPPLPPAPPAVPAKIGVVHKVRIPIYQPELGGNEKLYVNDCLDTNWISSRGKYVTRFEAAFGEYV